MILLPISVCGASREALPPMEYWNVAEIKKILERLCLLEKGLSYLYTLQNRGKDGSNDEYVK